MKMLLLSVIGENVYSGKVEKLHQFCLAFPHKLLSSVLSRVNKIWPAVVGLMEIESMK